MACCENLMYNNLYSPWRSPYFSESGSNECIFCVISQKIFQVGNSSHTTRDSTHRKPIIPHALTDTDKEYHVFYKDSLCFGIMNLYPYTPGHFMLIPHAHVDSPSDLSQDSWLHLSTLSQKAITMLEEYGADGVNMGINIKKAAGAGIPKHLHLHFVPRFAGDTNFITAIGNTRVYGVEFEKIFDKITQLAKQYLC